MVPTKLAVHPAQTYHILVQFQSELRDRKFCNFGIVVRMHQCLPTTMLEILKSHAAIVQKALIDTGHFRQVR